MGYKRSMEVDVEVDMAAKKRRRLSIDDPVRTDPVEGAKKGLTAVPSQFQDGAKGPYFINVRDGEFPKEVLESFNERYRGRYYANVSTTESHFMNAEAKRDIHKTISITINTC